MRYSEIPRSGQWSLHHTSSSVLFIPALQTGNQETELDHCNIGKHLGPDCKVIKCALRPTPIQQSPYVHALSATGARDTRRNT